MTDCLDEPRDLRVALTHVPKHSRYLVRHTAGAPAGRNREPLRRVPADLVPNQEADNDPEVGSCPLPVARDEGGEERQ